MITFSIVVPCYNAEVFIRKCLDRILGQTYHNFEVICVNDGSKDNTLSILNEYANKDNRIKVVDQQNIGLSGARNTGMAQSHGKYVTFIDPDDWFELNYFKEVADNIEDEDIIQCGYIKAYADHNDPQKFFTEKRKVSGEDMDDFKRRYIGLIGTQLKRPETTDNYSSVCFKFMKLSTIREHNILFDNIKEIGTGEDMLFTCKYIIHCKSAVCLPIEGYYYLRNVSSSTKTFQANLLNQWNELYRRLWTVISYNPDYIEPYNNRRRLSLIGLSLNQIYCSDKFLEQRKKVCEILSSPLYEGIYNDFDISNLPNMWKLFFYCVKTRKYTMLTILLRIMNILRNR